MSWDGGNRSQSAIGNGGEYGDGGVMGVLPTGYKGNSEPSSGSKISHGHRAVSERYRRLIGRIFPYRLAMMGRWRTWCD